MSLTRFAWVPVCGLLLASVPSFAGQPPAPPTDAAVLAAARAIMGEVRYAVLVTHDPAGPPQARTMDVFPPEDGFVVWMATNPRSRKVDQIRKDPRVTLHYSDTRAPELGYVTLYGRARLVDDPAEKQKRWKVGWEAFWPDRAASYLLVEVTPERIDVFSPKHDIAADPVTWKPAGAAVVRR